MAVDVAPSIQSGASSLRDRLPPWQSVVVTSLLLVAAALITSVIWERILAPWEFDETYNLQVVENLGEGNGYSTNGAVRGVGPWEFDPYISTGPAVLLPVWLLSIPFGILAAARLAMFTFFAALLVMVRALTGPGRRGWFVFALVLLATLPFLQAANPLLVLGEIPATTYLIGALVAMRRESYLLMGLLIGLTVLAKLNYTMAALAIAAVWIGSTLLQNPTSWRSHATNVVRIAVGAAIPVVTFELYRLISLGGHSGYVDNIESLRSFIETQRLSSWTQAPALLGDKIVALVGIVTPTFVVALAICALSTPFLRRSSRPAGDERGHEDDVVSASDSAPADDGRPADPDVDDIQSIRVEVGLVASGTTIIGTWMFLSSVPWLRQGAPGAMLLVAGLVLTFSRRAIPALHDAERSTRISTGIVVAAVGGLFGLAALTATIDNVVDATGSQARQAANEQRDVADLIQQSGATGIVTDGWFQNPELQLLSGVPSVSMPGTDDRPILVVHWLKYLFVDDPDGLAGDVEDCSSVLYSSDSYLVCWPLSGDDVDQ
jgi:hypothetical protein